MNGQGQPGTKRHLLWYKRRILRLVEAQGSDVLRMRRALNHQSGARLRRALALLERQQQVKVNDG